MSDERFGHLGRAFSSLASQLCSESALAEKTKLDRFVDRQIRTAVEMVGDSCGVLRDERHRFLSLNGRSGCLFLKDMAKPGGGIVTVCKVRVVLLRIAVARAVPIGVTK